MRVLVACEFSGVVRDAFAARGHDAWSCDILPSERPGNHLQRSVFDVDVVKAGWDLMIAHPDCTFLTVSGARWMREEWLSRACARDTRRAELAGSLHTLRHTYISHLVMAGVPLRTVQKLAGHSTIAVTEKYAHLAPDHLRNAGRAISL